MNIWQLYAQFFSALILGFVLLQADLLLTAIIHIPLILFCLAGFLCALRLKQWITALTLGAVLFVACHIQLISVIPWAFLIILCPLVLYASKTFLNSTSAPLSCALSIGSLLQLYWLIGKKIILYPYFVYTSALIPATILLAILCDRFIMGRRGNRSWNF